MRRQLEDEIRAQFGAFRDLGLSLDRVNCHRHMQVHPSVLAAVLKIGREFGLRAIRLPFEPFLASWRAATRTDLVGRFAHALALKPWTFLLRRRLRRAGVATNDRLFGMYDSGDMISDWIKRLIPVLPEGIAEIHLHPALARGYAFDQMDAAYRHRDEFEALVDLRLAAVLDADEIERITFRQIGSAES